MPLADWWPALFPDPSAILGKIGVVPGTVAVDLCSGNGWFTVPLGKVARKVLAVDIDPALLTLASQRLAEEGVDNVQLIEGDAYALPELVRESVDFVLLANAWHGVPDRRRLVQAIRNVLTPTGKLVVLNWHQRPREATIVLGEPRGPRTELRVPPEETIAVVEFAGMSFDHLVELPPFHYAVVFRNA
jgi:ubiquinone/menaquinone biosynthesis C-methylase UbiE